MVPENPDALLSRDAAATSLTAAGYRISSATLSTLACRGDGPKFDKFGNRTVYRWGDVLSWAEARASKTKRAA